MILSMIKILISSFYLLICSHALFAGEKAPQIFEQYNFTQDEATSFFTKFPELTSLEIASEAKAANDDQNFSLKLYAENSNDVYIIQKNQTKLDIEKTYVPFEVSTKTFEGQIHGTLFDTLLKDIGNEKIARQIAEAFKEDFITTKGLRAPAAYSFDVIQYYDQDRLVKSGNVIKATLMIGKAISEKVLQQDFETLKWNLLPVIPEKNDRPFYAPVKSSRVSSLFQLNRRHPVKRRIQPHNGIDFVAQSGTPVYPALEGEIIAIGKARAKGKFILVQHDNGYQTTYDHLRKFSKGLRVGSRVEMNEAIGEVGRTGYATGAHLHFGVINQDGFYVNPLYLVKDYCYDEKDLKENENGDLFEVEDNGSDLTE
jgi:murein DD-endopeptidase MepM/ murein hydrolase activator NlpD